MKTFYSYCKTIIVSLCSPENKTGHLIKITPGMKMLYSNHLLG